MSNMLKKIFNIMFGYFIQQISKLPSINNRFMKVILGLAAFGIVALIIVLLFNNIVIFDGAEDTPEWRMRNFRIWKNTPAWELAQAVRYQKTSKIKKILQSTPGIVNYQEPRFGCTLLIWAVGLSKYKSAETLLQCGANPNLQTKDGRTALFVAAGSPWVDSFSTGNTKYIDLLLNYKANPNICFIGGGTDTMTFPGTSPLIASISNGIEKTQALINAGADINHKAKFGFTAAIQALYMSGLESSTEQLRYAHYLIVEKKAKISEPYFNMILMSGDDPNEKFYPVSLLRDINPIGSEEIKMKNEIIEEFKRQGVKY